MYVYACFLHIHAYSKYAYACNWTAHASPMYVHAYSCPTTLIWSFFTSISSFHLFNMPLSALVFYVYESLLPCFVVNFPLYVRLGFLFNSLFNMPWLAYDMTMHWCIGAVVQWGNSCIHMNMHMFGICFCDKYEHAWLNDVFLMSRCL